MLFWQFLGDLHPRLVQFPLVLLLAALVFDALGLIVKSERMTFAAGLLAAGGTFFLLLAFVCGIYAEVWAGRAGIPQEQIEWHELMANIASWGFVVLVSWRMFIKPDQRKSLAIYTSIGLLWYSMLIATGYFGGKLVFDYGAAVTGATANNVLAMHDLNVLATRQTDANVHWSEVMHHGAGWATLALSISLFLNALYPKKGEKLKWIGPGLLVAGGIALFFLADIDLYRLTDLRQLRDREVQLHKTLAIVLCTIGILGLKRAKKIKHRATSQNEQSRATSSPNTPQALSTPSKAVAVMALIGGGMLFTHVHTVAPYANVAAGVYIAHIVMGLTALGIGAARLLQDALPRHRRSLAVLFALLLCFESVLLITYNEGLPWYIGYGRYNRWGPHHGTVAPYGPIRAELTFDNKSAKFDFYVLDRNADVPANVATDHVDLLVDRGYTETAVHLLAESQSHFSAAAPFMKGAEAFCARAALPVGAGVTMGYFDPWVTDLIKPIPPNELAKYQCPMHEGMLSETPGVCRLCGMPLVPILTSPRTTLHDADYDMQFSAAPISPTQMRLRFMPLAHGQPLHDLALVHEHLLHLIVVSSDLKFYDHVHPVLQPDGSLTLDYTFPAAGHYLLYADITPSGERNQVFRLPVNLGTEMLAPTPDLSVSPAAAKEIGDSALTAELIFEPRTPAAGLHTSFFFRLSDSGRPFSDLEPYLAAMGHCVIISADTQMYLHCHPEQLETPTPETRGGPDIPFHTVFPHPGLYKIWGQFQRRGKVITADFVVDVKSPILPPKIINFLLND